jgi:hypothetical protein
MDYYNKMNDQTEAGHILELSRELLDDIELDRFPADQLVLKASRLARLAGSDEIRRWLSYELGGYNKSDPVSLKYMGVTGRWIKREDAIGYWAPLGQIEAAIDTKKAQIEATRLTGLSGDSAMGAIRLTNKNHQVLSSAISQFSGIQSRVLGILHSFVSNIYYERQFAEMVESVFEGYKRDIDALIAEKAGEVLTKLPSVVARLKEGDEEAVSQALSTCRRILETFADAIFPPSEDTFKIGESSLKLDASKHQNRINAYIAQRCQSSSRRTRLRQNISNLFDRVSTGIHKDISANEAYALFLNVYLFLGEVLHLEEPTNCEVTVE